MGKFYYVGILTVIIRIKNPRTSRERKFNFLLSDVIIFVSLLSADGIIILRLKA